VYVPGCDHAPKAAPNQSFFVTWYVNSLKLFFLIIFGSITHVDSSVRHTVWHIFVFSSTLPIRFYPPHWANIVSAVFANALQASTICSILNYFQ
jgi:hypothetical protein